MLEQMRAAAKQQGVPLTPETEAQMLKQYRDMGARMIGMKAAVQAHKQGMASPAPTSATPIAATAVAAAPSASNWLEQIQRHKASARPTLFADARDGFTADGRLWMDPEGEVQSYGADPATGNVTYLVNTGGDRYTVRFANVHASEAPVTVGTLTMQDERTAFAGIDGTNLAGESAGPLADGLVVTRPGSYFRYEYGSRPTSNTVPPEYQVLYAQRGDVVGTGYILAVKQAKSTFKDAFLGTSGNQYAKRPTSFGSRDPDFALIDTKTGRLVPIPRSEATTELNWNRRRGNNLHFFNAINWYATSIGPIAVVYGDDSASLYGVNLRTGEKVTLFKRVMGLNNWSSEATPDGGVRVHAQLGFKHDVIDDIRTRFTGAQ